MFNAYFKDFFNQDNGDFERTISKVESFFKYYVSMNVRGRTVDGLDDAVMKSSYGISKRCVLRFDGYPAPLNEIFALKSAGFKADSWCGSRGF